MATFLERINELYDEARDRNFRTTRADFAKQLGVSIGRSNAYIDGNGNPDFETLKLIAKNKGVKYPPPLRQRPKPRIVHNYRS